MLEDLNSRVEEGNGTKAVPKSAGLPGLEIENIIACFQMVGRLVAGC